jgi:hypothetical protein
MDCDWQNLLPNLIVFQSWARNSWLAHNALVFAIGFWFLDLKIYDPVWSFTLLLGPRKTLLSSKTTCPRQTYMAAAMIHHCIHDIDGSSTGSNPCYVNQPTEETETDIDGVGR